MTQKKLISSLLKKHKHAIIVGSLGTICYDLTEELKHGGRREVYLIRGGMGCAMGVGLGLALNQKKKVIVLIGDGSFIMKMGSISTTMAYKPKNLFIYILQNNVYSSTGGQGINFNIPRPPKSHFRVCRVD